MKLGFSSDGTVVSKPVTMTSPSYQKSGGGAGSGAVGDGANPSIVQQSFNMAEPAKRKRGRPRKYGPDGAMALAFTPISRAAPPSSGGNSGGLYLPTLPSSAPKKARGRPPGPGRKQHMIALAQFIVREWLAGSAGVGFTPHVITVKTGEDIFSKIMSFPQHGPRAICILSANGAISNVTLRQPATSGGTVTHEGRFEILSLSGSFLLSESGGQRSRTGGLSVSLAGPDGRVLGGGVAGLLTAASPVQVVMGSFIADDGSNESKSPNPLDPPKMKPGGAAGTRSPPSRGTLSESSGGRGSPLNQSARTRNNSTPHGILTNTPWK